MPDRTISFEIDDELEGHLIALANDWNKDPIQLAKALFVEELMGQTSGSRGVPHSRRDWYRNADVYFTPEEKEARAKELEAFWKTEEGQAVQEQQRLNLERLEASTKRFKERGR